MKHLKSTYTTTDNKTYKSKRYNRQGVSMNEEDKEELIAKLSSAMTFIGIIVFSTGVLIGKFLV